MGYALCRLARLVNEVEKPGEGDKYFELAKFLLDTRHTVAEHRSPYHQSHRPVVEMTDAVGHAVRATYFYTAMADLAMLTGDEGYRSAVDKIWANAIHRKHYITGGVGASHRGEAFSDDFDLRNDGYCESCAGCGMTFWADRMNRIHHRRPLRRRAGAYALQQHPRRDRAVRRKLLLPESTRLGRRLATPGTVARAASATSPERCWASRI